MCADRIRPTLNPLLTTPSRPLPKTIGVVGAGTIGPDIAYYLKSAIPDLTLKLVDVREEAFAAAIKRIGAYADKGVKKRKLSPERAEAVKANLHGTSDYAELADCDWVLEAATENLELKRKIFADIEAVVAPEALITSNTSSLPASRIFAQLEHPGRATVTHFFAPAFQNPAVEVIAWEQGDPAVVEDLRWLFANTGKVPLVTSDDICFMLDRIFDNWCNEAAILLADATAPQIDSVAAELVHAGPFFVLNLARGNPIIVETNTLQMEEGEHYRPAEIFKSVDTWVTTRPGRRVEVDAERAGKIRDRLRGILFSQSFDIIDRQIGAAADLNLGCALALGFKQGPLDLMRELGDAEVERVCDRFTSERPGMPGPKEAIASYQPVHRHVLVDDLDGIKVISLRRPQAMNALSDEVTDEILGVLQKETEATGFIVVGYGDRAFCAGADIGKFPDLLGDAKASAQFARDCSRLLVHLDQMKQPVVAALNGMALGGGLELALRCHGIVAQEAAWLQLPEITLGIAPGIGGMVVPFRRWPAAATVFHDMLRLGRKLKAAEALELGIVDGRLAKSYAELIELAVARVRELAAGFDPIPDAPVEIPLPPETDGTTPKGQQLSREVIALIDKATMEAARSPSLSAALEIGYEAFGATACTAAAKEGISSFFAKRPADFVKTG